MNLPKWIKKWLNRRKPPSFVPRMTLQPGASAVTRLPPELEKTLTFHFMQGHSVSIEHGGIIRDGNEYCRHVLIKANGQEIASVELHWTQEPPVGNGMMLELQALRTIREGLPPRQQ